MKKDKAHGSSMRLYGLLVLIAVLVGGALAGPLRPLVQKMSHQAAYFAVAATLPEGAIGALKERFQGYLLDEEAESLQSTAPEAPQAPAVREESPLSEPSAQPVQHPTPLPKKPPQIEEKYRGVLIEEQMLGRENDACLKHGAGYVRNYTNMNLNQIAALLEQPVSLKPAADGRVEVLIVHTHATESYEGYDSDFYDVRNDWRSTDNNCNMVAVGDVLAAQLEAAGIGVIHDTTQHDYPSYNGSYERAADTIQRYLKEYPDIKMILDVHRDGIQRDATTIVKPATVIDGRKAAQVMIISGSDQNGSLGIPNWAENLRLACGVTDAVEKQYPTLMRPVFLSGGRYNMHLSTGTILLEMGSQANTLEEALYSAELLGDALGHYLQELALQDG